VYTSKVSLILAGNNSYSIAYQLDQGWHAASAAAAGKAQTTVLTLQGKHYV
jgi:hypothetical protein